MLPITLLAVQFGTDQLISSLYRMRSAIRPPANLLKNLKLRTPMKKTSLWCLIGLLSLGSAVRSQAQQTGATEKAVVALEEQWLQSQKTNNPDLVAPLLADKFVNTSI